MFNKNHIKKIFFFNYDYLDLNHNLLLKIILVNKWDYFFV